MKQILESLSEFSAVAAAVLWFLSARVRMRKRNNLGRGLGAGWDDDPKAVLLLIYRQSRWSAWAAIAAGLAAIFAVADALVPKI